MNDVLGKAVSAMLRTMRKSTRRVFAIAHAQATSDIRCALLCQSSPCGTALLHVKGNVVRNSEVKYKCSVKGKVRNDSSRDRKVCPNDRVVLTAQSVWLSISSPLEKMTVLSLRARNLRQPGVHLAERGRHFCHLFRPSLPFPAGRRR